MTASHARRRRYRRRTPTTRTHRLTVRFSAAELDAIRAAAEAADLTVAGYCGQASVAATRRGQAAATVQPGREDLAELQRQLFEARTAVNRIGTNLNQAVAALNTTGAPPTWLPNVVALTKRTVERLDEVTSLIHRRLR